jgi:hypothetical protein
MPWVYRSTGAWGSGLGANLTVAQFDGNTWETEQRIEALEADMADAVGAGITNIVATGTIITIYWGASSTTTVDLPVGSHVPAVVDEAEGDSDGAYTFALVDANRYLRAGADVDEFVMPDEADVDFPINTEIHLRIAPDGNTLVPVTEGGTDVVINEAYGCENVILGPGSTVTLKKVAANEWDMIGGQLELVSA